MRLSIVSKAVRAIASPARRSAYFVYRDALLEQYIQRIVACGL